MAATYVDLTRDASDSDCDYEEVNSSSSETQEPPSKKRKAGDPTRSPLKRVEYSAMSTVAEISEADDVISMQLLQSIDRASVWELRDILKKVCRESLLAEKLVEEHLLSGADKGKLKQLDKDESAQINKSLQEAREQLRGDELDAISLAKCGGHGKSPNGDDSTTSRNRRGLDEATIWVQSVNASRDRRQEALQGLKKLLYTSQQGKALYLYLLGRDDIKGKNAFITLSAFLRKVSPAVLVARLNQEIVSSTKKRAKPTQGDHGDVVGLRSTDCEKAWANYKKEVAAGSLDAWVKPVYTHAELRALGLGWSTCGVLEPGVSFRQAEPTFDDDGAPASKSPNCPTCKA